MCLKIKLVTAMAAHCENCTDLKPELGRLDCKARILRLEIAQMIRLLSARLPRHRSRPLPSYCFLSPGNGSSSQPCYVFDGRGFGLTPTLRGWAALMLVCSELPFINSLVVCLVCLGNAPLCL